MNDDIKHIDNRSFPDGLTYFCNNIPNAGYHNLYLLQTIDRDGINTAII